MTIRLFAALLACLVLSTTAHADAVKEIALKGLKTDKPSFDRDLPQATEIRAIAELKKIFTQKEVVEEISKQVDFDKQKLVFFVWTGTGVDTLTARVDKDDVTFIYRRGGTLDVRYHYHLFAIPKDARHKVETAK
jgi:hypothetical protein